MKNKVHEVCQASKLNFTIPIVLKTSGGFIKSQALAISSDDNYNHLLVD